MPPLASVNPFYRRLILTIAYLAAIAAFVLLFQYIRDLLIVVILAIVLTYVLQPAVIGLERSGISKTPAILLVYSVVGLVIVVFLRYLIPFIVDEAGRINEILSQIDFHASYDETYYWLNEHAPGLTALLGLEEGKSEVILQKLLAIGKSYFQYSWKMAARLAAIVALGVIIPFLAFFFLRDGAQFTRRFIELVPNRYFEMTLSLVYRIDKQLGNYISGLLIESSIVALMTWVALEVIGVKFALILGIINGAANMIPYFGPLLAWVPIGLVTLITYDPPALGLVYMAIILIVVQILDNWIIKLIVISKAVQIHPAVVLLVVLTGGKLAGGLGMFIAIPTYAVLKVIVSDFYDHLKKYRII